MTRRIDLTALIADDGGTIVLDGVEHRVLPISGAAYERHLQSADADEEERVRTAYDIAALQVPSLAREQVQQLTPKQVLAIVGLSMETAVDVERSDPNGSGPEALATPA